METASYTQTFDSDLQEMVTWCRTLKSRGHWPGTTLGGRHGDTLNYLISIRVKSGIMADADTDEDLGPVTESADGVVEFAAELKCSWLDGDSHNNTLYRFIPGTPNTLEFTFNYETPPSKLVKAKNLPAFRGSMAKVVSLYVEGLISGRPASTRQGAASVSG